MDEHNRILYSYATNGKRKLRTPIRIPRPRPLLTAGSGGMTISEVKAMFGGKRA